jgi:hypothetical protein
MTLLLVALVMGQAGMDGLVTQARLASTNTRRH